MARLVLLICVLGALVCGHAAPGGNREDETSIGLVAEGVNKNGNAGADYENGRNVDKRKSHDNDNNKAGSGVSDQSVGSENDKGSDSGVTDKANGKGSNGAKNIENVNRDDNSQGKGEAARRYRRNDSQGIGNQGGRRGSGGKGNGGGGRGGAGPGAGGKGGQSSGGRPRRSEENVNHSGDSHKEGNYYKNAQGGNDSGSVGNSKDTSNTKEKRTRDDTILNNERGKQDYSTSENGHGSGNKDDQQGSDESHAKGNQGAVFEGSSNAGKVSEDTFNDAGHSSQNNEKYENSKNDNVKQNSSYATNENENNDAGRYRRDQSRGKGNHGSQGGSGSGKGIQNSSPGSKSRHRRSKPSEKQSKGKDGHYSDDAHSDSNSSESQEKSHVKNEERDNDNDKGGHDSVYDEKEKIKGRSGNGDPNLGVSGKSRHRRSKNSKESETTDGNLSGGAHVNKNNNGSEIKEKLSVDKSDLDDNSNNDEKSHNLSNNDKENTDADRHKRTVVPLEQSTWTFLLLKLLNLFG